MLNIEKEREVLVAEIELFIAEAMKAYVVERWADSYQNTEPFAYTIDHKNEIWWMKTQAHQLWQFWKAAKTQEAQKLEGCVVVPLEPTQKMLDAFPEVEYEDTYKGTCSIWVDDLTLIKGYKAMVEAARGGK